MQRDVEPGPNHLHLGALDLARTESFYGRWFGFVRTSEHGKGLFLRGPDGFLLALDPVHERESLPGWFHVGFCRRSEDAVLDLHRRMQEEGVPMHRDLVRFPGEAAAFYCLDPDGVVIEVSWHADEV